MCTVCGHYHEYCLWPLLLLCTTLVCVLFVATTMYTISVYYFSICTVCGTLVCVLFVATTTCTTLVCVCTPVLLLYAVLVPTLLLFGSFSVLAEERSWVPQLSQSVYYFSMCVYPEERGVPPLTPIHLTTHKWSHLGVAESGCIQIFHNAPFILAFACHFG